MIEFNSITFAYPHSAPIFRDFTWKINPGEKWAIIGSSGCGKTTLLYLLAGLYSPQKGEITVDGQLLSRPRPRTGLILQDYGLLPWATLRQNADLGRQIRGFYGPDGKHAPVEPGKTIDIQTWLERLGIDVVADKYPFQVSGGQRQRAAIARTLAISPDILLMDEPFSSLDAITREDLQNLSLALSDEQKLTMIIVTHSIEEAAVLGRKILLLTPSQDRRMHIIDNPTSGEPGYRSSRAYQDTCQLLRRAMQNETT